MQLPAIATTTVGSFPRPAWLAERVRTNTGSHVRLRFDGELLREALDDATELVLKRQEETGLDLLSDGEQRRLHFISHILAACDGIDTVNQGAKDNYRRIAQTRLVPRVVGKITRRAPAVLDDLRFAKARTARPIKMTVPGPLTVVDSTLDEFYGNEEALALDFAAALNLELLDLQSAGCDALQIDEPAMTRYHEKVTAYAARALDRCLEGIHIPTFVHLCYGYPGGGGQHQYEYPELLQELMKTRIGGFAVEFARSNYDPKVLEICRGRLIMFGCIDPGSAPAPSVASVVEKVRHALNYIAPDQLLLAPDCGLMTITPELAAVKTRVLVAAARELRRGL